MRLRMAQKHGDDPGRDEKGHGSGAPHVISASGEAGKGKAPIVKLDLSSLRLDRVPASLISLHSCYLLKLDLSYNNLEIVPESVTSLANLKVLDISHNRLKELPQSMGDLLSVKILNVSANSLLSLPLSIQYCSALQELYAEKNQLQDLPSTIGFRLKHIRKIVLHSNMITELPPSASCMKSLKLLDLHMNRLRSLPEDMQHLTSLEYLDVSKNFNHLTSLPDSIGGLTSLLELDVSYNQISFLPDSIGDLKNLQNLGLQGNPLVIPPREIVEHSVEAVKRYMARRLRIKKSKSSGRRSGWFWKVIGLERAKACVKGTEDADADLCWDEYRWIPSPKPHKRRNESNHCLPLSLSSSPSHVQGSPPRLSTSAPQSPYVYTPTSDIDKWW